MLPSTFPDLIWVLVKEKCLGWRILIKLSSVTRISMLTVVSLVRLLTRVVSEVELNLLVLVSSIALEISLTTSLSWKSSVLNLAWRANVSSSKVSVMSVTGLLSSSLNMVVSLLVLLNGMVPSTTLKVLILKISTNISWTRRVSRVILELKKLSITKMPSTRNVMSSFPLLLNKLLTRITLTDSTVRSFPKLLMVLLPSLLKKS